MRLCMVLLIALTPAVLARCALNPRNCGASTAHTPDSSPMTHHGGDLGRVFNVDPAAVRVGHVRALPQSRCDGKGASS